MKKTIIILIIILPNICFSTYITGLDSINLGNRIELIDIKINAYTNQKDTTIYYIAKYPTKSNGNEYLIFDDKINNFILHQNDSVINYYLDKKKYKVYFNKVRHIAYYFSHLFVMLEDNKLFFSKIPTKEYDSEVTKYFYNSSSDIGTFDVVRKIGVITANNKFIFNYSTNVVELEISLESNGTYDDTYSTHQIYKPSKNDSLFDFYDNFYYNEKENYELDLSINDKKEVAPAIKVGEYINPDYELIGINRPNSRIDSLFEGKPYLMIYNWGVWCGYCVYNMENIKMLNSKNYENLAFITINCESGRATRAELETYILRKNIEYPVYENCDFIKQNRIYSYPMLTVIDRNYKIVAMRSGNPKDVSVYEEFLREYKLIN